MGAPMNINKKKTSSSWKKDFVEETLSLIMYLKYKRSREGDLSYLQIPPWAARPPCGCARGLSGAEVTRRATALLGPKSLLPLLSAPLSPSVTLISPLSHPGPAANPLPLTPPTHFRREGLETKLLQTCLTPDTAPLPEKTFLLLLCHTGLPPPKKTLLILLLLKSLFAGLQS
jgi:hypothetical protein